MFNSRLRSSCMAAAALGTFHGQVAIAQVVEPQPLSTFAVARQATIPAGEPVLSPQDKLSLMRQKVKYVFVLFQENRSFDHYFGTFPGANGLFSRPHGQTLGFDQPIVNTDGTAGTISPFIIPPTVTAVNGNIVPLYPADTDSVDHSHTGINNSLDVDAKGGAHNDRYALNAEGLTMRNGQIVSLTTGQPPATTPTLVQKQRAELTLSHIDCDTIPFLWQYADRFALLDNFHQTTIGPSTPNAIAMIAGQSGETQWALHPEQASSNTASASVRVSGGEPIIDDYSPYGGSNFDPSPNKLTEALENPAIAALNQTYATLPLSFEGPQIKTTIKSDQNPVVDLADVQHDIDQIAAKNLTQVPWGWYQEGFDLEPTDKSGTISHHNYVTHHNGTQYFGYIADNTKEVLHLHGLNDFFDQIKTGALPQHGGVFYVRGGYGNNDSLLPQDPNPAVQLHFPGNDDHPGYSDAQISEALIADEVNAIAQSPYWNESAIIITYDETDGLYDHAPLKIRSTDPEGQPLAGGPRIPGIVISPYATSHVVVHEYEEHGSVIKFIDELFGLVPLADLPDEARARRMGEQNLGQPFLEPADGSDVPTGDMMVAFDNDRLLGRVPLLPADYAMIPPGQVLTLPHYGGRGCATLHVVPTDYVAGRVIDPPPADFNPRPGTTPGTPTSGTWKP